LTESLDATLPSASSSSPRVQIESTTLTLTAAGDISFYRDFVPAESARIRQTTSER
jgi:hypothetical protein